MQSNDVSPEHHAPSAAGHDSAGHDAASSASPADGLQAEQRTAVERYVAALQGLAGPRLLSVAIYGQRHAWLPGDRQPLVNALVLSEVDLELLAAIGKQGPLFGRWGLAAPWALTPRQIERSLDTFPLELIEIQQQHLTAFGGEYFAQLVFERGAVRAQCERELRLSQIQLQRGVMMATGSQRSLRHLTRQLRPVLLRVVRGIAWLTHPPPAGDDFALVAAVERARQQPLPGIRRVLDDADAAEQIKVQQLYADIVGLGDYIDRWS